MKSRLLVFLLAGSLLAWAQGSKGMGGMQGGGMNGGQKGSGPAMGSGSGSMGQGNMGQGSMGQGNMGSGKMGPGNRSGMGPMDANMPHQQPMTKGQMKSGSFQMLQQMTGMDSAHLQQMYANSGAQNFGQFASAVVVSHNMNLDQHKVMHGLETMNLKQTLKKMGVPPDTAKAEVKKAEHQVKEANKNKTKS
jgi:hypothetical protein